MIIFPDSYACGKWMKNHENQRMTEDSHFVRKEKEIHEKLESILESKPSESDQGPWSIRQARIFYKSCVDRGKI